MQVAAMQWEQFSSTIFLILTWFCVCANACMCVCVLWFHVHLESKPAVNQPTGREKELANPKAASGKKLESLPLQLETGRLGWTGMDLETGMEDWTQVEGADWADWPCCCRFFR